MSSSTRLRPDRSATRVAVLLLAVCAVQWLCPSGAAAAVPLPTIAVLPGPEQTCLVVDVGTHHEPLATDRVSVTADDVPQRATVEPVVSGRLAVALVVDASTAGAPALPGWLSAAARFILETPATTRAAVVADTTPPAVVAPLQQGPMEIVRAVSAVQARGERSTSDALTLALNHLPASPADPRVIVFYTSAADAGGESAAALAERLAQANVILVVVGPARNGAYWSGVSRATGGFLAPVLAPLVVPALDQVGAMLRARYLLKIPTPGQLPARVSVRIDMGDVTLTGDTVVPVVTLAQAYPPTEEPPVRAGTVVWVAAVVGVLAVLVAAAVVRRQWAPPLPDRSGGVPGTGPPTAARGRAAVPGSPPARQPP